MADDPFAGAPLAVPQQQTAGDPFAAAPLAKPAPTGDSFDFAPMAQQLHANIAAHNEAKPVSGLIDALDAGFQSSVTGLLARGKAPDKALGQDASFGEQLAATVGGVAGDLPAMVAGGIAGTPAGGGVASVATGMAASFAVPALLRSTLMDAYEKGDFQNFPDFWSRASGILFDAAKGWVTGAAAGVAGGAAGAALPAAASPALRSVARGAAEIGTMTVVGKGLEGQVPTAADFATAGIVLGGLKGSQFAAGKMRSIYAKTGIKPDAVIADAARDPSIKADLLSTNRAVPEAYAKGATDPLLAAVAESIHRQESGGAQTARTSVTGARGGMQIQPDTFKQYARPGESIDNPSDNLAVGRRIIADLYQHSGGDPARVAVGYFSGKGNIAPEGSPTPWKRDLSDPTGKKTSSYVNDVMRRLGGMEVAPAQAARIEPDVLRIEPIRPDTAAVSDALRSRGRGDSEAESASQVWQAYADASPSRVEPPIFSEPFRARSEWQDVPSGELLPAGLEIRMDMNTGRQQARTLDDGRSSPSGSAIQDVGGAIIRSADAAAKTSPELVDTIAPIRKWLGNEDAPLTPDQQRQFASGLQTHLSNPTSTAIPPAVHAAMNKLVPAPAGGGSGGPPRPPATSAAAPMQPRPAGSSAAQQAVLSKINVGGKAESGRASLHTLYTDMIDRLHPIAMARDIASAAGGKISAAQDPYRMARLYSGVVGKAEHMLEFGTFDFKTGKNNGAGLREILEPVRNDLDGLRAYLVSERSIELEGRGITSGIDIAAARHVVASGAGQYGQIAKDLHAYQDRVTQYLRDSGVLSAEGYRAMRAANQAYIPFFRVMDDAGGGIGKGLRTWNPVKRIKGSERDIIDPLESIIKNTFLFTSLADRNAVGDAYVKMAAHAPELAQKVPATMHPIDVSVPELQRFLAQNGIHLPQGSVSGDMTIFRPQTFQPARDEIAVYRDGKREVYRVDPEVADAFTGLNTETANAVVKMLSIPAKTLRAGAVLSPDFMVRNPVRDLVTALINSKGIFSPIDSVSGLVSAVRKDNAFQEWMKSGGANSTLVGMDRRYMQESLEKLTAETGLMSKAWNVVRNPLEMLRVVSELSEQATRLGEFKKVAKSGDLAEAAYASREVTLDFSRIGAKTRAVNMITAFFNAGLQGLDRTIREAKDRPVSFATRSALAITMPSVLLWAANHDDPRYREIPQWQRDLFWIVMTKDHIYRIPKPFEVGIVFGTLPERLLDAFVDERKDAWKGFASAVLGALVPNFSPTAVTPVIEQFANRSTFTGRALVPQSVEGQLPEYQYTEYSTETAKLLGRMFGAIPGVREAPLDQNHPFSGMAHALTSPALLENYIRSWTGGLGMYALQISDAGVKAAGVVPSIERATPTLADIPVIKAFVARYPSASAQSIQDFYDGYERNKAFLDTWKAQAKQGNVEALQRIQQAGGQQMFVTLDGINQALGDMRKLVIDTDKNPQMTPDDKRQLIDGMYFRMIDIARAGNAMMENVREGR